MSGNAKRNLVVGTMAVLVCAAVGLNWKYSTQEALQQAEEAGTKILGEATLVSGQEGTELAEDTVYVRGLCGGQWRFRYSHRACGGSG